MELKRATVVAVPCNTYDPETVYQAVCAGVNALGGIAQFVRPEEKILVKPNLLKPAEIDSAVTTHPAVLRAVLRLLQESGCTSVKYGDSPGHDAGVRSAEKIGLNTKEPIYGATFAPMDKEVCVPFPDGLTEKEFYFAKEVAEADAIINVCKMKTHALVRLTGAVKNLFGLTCGYRKAREHVKFPNASVFSRMLIDIHRCVRPRLHIMDGIVAMEGNGPGAGTPTPMNVLLFSADPVAVDAVFCALVHVDPETVPTNVQGEAMGLGLWSTCCGLFTILSMIVYYFRTKLPIGNGIPFYSALAALWCMQPYPDTTKNNAWQRSFGTLTGAAFGLIFLLLLQLFEVTQPIAVYLLASVFVIPVIYTTVVTDHRNASFFSCVVFLSIALTHSFDENPFL